jgi:hypothetical protein
LNLLLMIVQPDYLTVRPSLGTAASKGLGFRRSPVSPVSALVKSRHDARHSRCPLHPGKRNLPGDSWMSDTVPQANISIADSRVSVKTNIERQPAAIVSQLAGLDIMPAFKLKSYQPGE